MFLRGTGTSYFLVTFFLSFSNRDILAPQNDFCCDCFSSYFIDFFEEHWYYSFFTEHQGIHPVLFLSLLENFLLQLQYHYLLLID